MIDSQDLNRLPGETVDDDVGKRKQEQFACSFHASALPEMRSLLQRADSLIEFSHRWLAIPRVVFF